MDKNGRNYCTGKSRHINIRLFFKDRVDKGEVKIEYCPTQMVLADYFTKPLKGKVFKIFRDVILGYKPILSLESIPVSIKERVGNNGEMIETIFYRKIDVARLSHKVQSRDKEIKRDSKIQVKYEETKINSKINNALKNK